MQDFILRRLKFAQNEQKHLLSRKTEGNWYVYHISILPVPALQT